MRFVGTTASVLFRLLAYSFLRWIPGRQGTYAVPLFFLLSLLSFQFNGKTRRNAQIVLLDKKDEGESPDDEVGEIDLSMATSIDARDVVITPPTKHDPTPTVIITKLSPPSFFSLLSSFLFGSPSASPRLNKVAVALNSLLFLAVLDSLWTPILLRKNEDLAFHRVGSITHNAVKILARTPPHLPNTVPVAGGVEEVEEGGARIAYRLTRPIGGKWIVASDAFNGTAMHDWTSMIKIDNLLASSEYEYRLLLPSSTAMTHHPSFPTLRTFVTSPDPALFDPTLSTAGGEATHYKFVTSSCLRANFPYAGPLAHDSIIGAQHLAKELELENDGGKGVGIKFMLFLGDFIYSDVPHFSGANKESYWAKYRGIFASPDWAAIYEKIPILSIYDDHEIFNDFSASMDDEKFAPANTAFVDYLGAGNPSLSFPTPTVEPVNYFDYRYGDSAFFIMDVRAYRSENSMEDGPEKTMLGATQKSVLLDWLTATNGTVTWKFIITSSPFMALWSHGDDTWAGFLNEREELLDILQYVPNVIILSGDRHEVAAASFRNGTVTEISTSPLNQFYLPVRTLSQSNAGALGVDDVLLKYLPDGNSKFTTLEVDNRIRNRPVVRIRVVIDGSDAWSVEVQGKQMAIAPIPSTVGALGKSLLELLGFRRRTWF